MKTFPHTPRLSHPAQMGGPEMKGMGDGHRYLDHFADPKVLGAGHNTITDRVPALLTPGEFVVKRAVAQKHLPLLRKMNAGGVVKGSGGQKPIRFKKGALHQQLGVPQGQKIPAKKMAAARSGKLGPLAEKRANFARNVLTGRK